MKAQGNSDQHYEAVTYPRPRPSIASVLRRVFTYRSLLKNLVVKQLRARYGGHLGGASLAALGLSVAMPLASVLLVRVVLGNVFQTGLVNLTLLLAVGILHWNFFVSAVVQGSSSLVTNCAVVRSINFPRAVLPVATVMAHLVHHLLSLLVLSPFFLLLGGTVTGLLFLYPFVLLLQVAATIGLALVSSVIQVFIQDFSKVIGFILTLLFWATPVIYPLSLVPENLRPWIAVNPLSSLFGVYQSVLYHGSWPTPTSLGVSLGSSLIVLCFGLAVFTRYESRLAEAL